MDSARLSKQFHTLDLLLDGYEGDFINPLSKTIKDIKMDLKKYDYNCNKNKRKV